MRFSVSSRPLLAALAALLTLFFSEPAHVRAQDAADYRRWLDQRAQSLLDQARNNEDRSQVGAEHARRFREELEAQKRAVEREKTYSYAQPVLTPDGKQIAAMVNDRYMTLEDLNSRVAAALRDVAPIEHPDPRERQRLREDQFLSVANSLISDWVMNSMLALQGRGMGFSVTEREVDDALAELQNADLERVGGEGPASPTAMIGIRESQLREEVRNSLIIEKYINSLVDFQFEDKDYQRIYNIDPASFSIPARVRAFHVFHPLPVQRDADTLRDIEKALGRVQKDLRRSDVEEMAEIVKRSDGQPWTAGDMGWVNSTNRTMPGVLLKAIFSTPVGEASPVFQSSEGYHVVRVLEREEGASGLEAARPQIRNFLFTKTKYATYQAMKPLYDIRYNTGGIKVWKEVSAEEARALGRMGSEPPEVEDGITITELRREIAQEKEQTAAEPESPAPSRSTARSRQDEGPVIDLSILQ